MKHSSCPDCGNDLAGTAECQLCGWLEPDGALPTPPVVPSNGEGLDFVPAEPPALVSPPPRWPVVEPSSSATETLAKAGAAKPRRGVFGKVALVVVLMGALGLGYEYMTSGRSDGDSAMTSSGEGQTTSVPETELTRTDSVESTPEIQNDGTTVPSLELVASLLGREDASTQWVELVAAKTRMAVAGVDSPEGAGHFVMVSSAGRWTAQDGTLIVSDEDCDSLLPLGFTPALDASAVMQGHFCDPQLVYRIVESYELSTNGIGPLRVPRDLAEIETTQLVPDSRPWECSVSTPPFPAYRDFVSRVWTEGGQLVAFELTGGANVTRSGASIGMSESSLLSVLGASLEDRTSEYWSFGADRVLAVTDDDSELAFLLQSGIVRSMIVRLNNFDPGNC